MPTNTQPKRLRIAIYGEPITFKSTVGIAIARALKDIGFTDVTLKDDVTFIAGNIIQQDDRLREAVKQNVNIVIECVLTKRRPSWRRDINKNEDDDQ